MAGGHVLLPRDAQVRSHTTHWARGVGRIDAPDCGSTPGTQVGSSNRVRNAESRPQRCGHRTAEVCDTGPMWAT